MKRKILLLMCALYFISGIRLYAQSPVDNFINDPSLKNASISIMVKDLKTGKEIYRYRPNHPIIPASTMKVVTTATALEILGPAYRYETVLAYDGSIDSTGVLNGNLYIIGSGDPTLGSSKVGDKDFLFKWVEEVKALGINKIKGGVVADESRFDNEGHNPKWTWDDIGNYYAPGIYGLAYLDNTLRVTFKSGAVGTKPEIIDISPDVENLTIENNLQSGRIKFDSAYFYGAPKSLHRSVRGEIPANNPNFVVRAELPDPAMTLARDFHRQLSEQQIEILSPPFTLSSSSPSFPFRIKDRISFYTHYSVPLSQIIKEINEKSNNFYAEQVFKSISLHPDAAATNKRSLQIIRNFWKSKGLNINQLFQADGSGLSPTNAISASFLTDIMEYMYKQSQHKRYFFQSLPVAGKTGTLAGFLKKTPLSGKLYAKSGTISRVRSYTGYIIQNNVEWVFCVMVNNSGVNSWQTLSKIEHFLVDLTKR